MSEELPFDPEAIAGTLAHIAAGQGDAASVAALAGSVPWFEITGYDNSIPSPKYAHLKGLLS
jgi:hypothetical protein